MMKNIKTIVLGAAAIFLLAACNAEYTTLKGVSVIAFADTLAYCPVQQSGEAFEVPVAATDKADHDRTFAVEVLPSKSNAVYGYHYTIENQTITIPAGESAASVRILGDYDALESSSSLYFTLKLVSEYDSWEFNSDEIRVELRKVCPFNVEDFLGGCTVTSTFLYTYGSMLSDYSRDCEVEAVEGDPMSFIVKDVLEDGFDMKFTVDYSDLINPTVSLAEDTPVADTRTFFYTIYGNGLIIGNDAAGYTQSFNICDKYFYHYVTLSVENVGTVGTFINVFEFM